MADITVPVPDERHAEFYQFFGLWLAGSLNLFPRVVKGPESQSEAAEAPKPVYQPWGDSAEDVADAASLWKKLTLRARAMFSLLIDDPGKKFSGQQIADALDIPHGAHGVAGVLGYPGRHAKAIGRRLPTSWREDLETFESFYWMSEEDASPFKVARKQVEGTAE